MNLPYGWSTGAACKSLAVFDGLCSLLGAVIKHSKGRQGTEVFLILSSITVAPALSVFMFPRPSPTSVKWSIILPCSYTTPDNF